MISLEFRIINQLIGIIAIIFSFLPNTGVLQNLYNFIFVCSFSIFLLDRYFCFLGEKRLKNDIT